jgi:hypothetical protein
MAGFDSSAGGFNSNVGGSFNPALGQIGSGQFSVPGYGIQPPRVSNPFNVDAMNLGAGQRPSQRAFGYNSAASEYAPGPDTSGQHQANVAMAQQGFGDMYNQGDIPGYSSYGFSPNTWQMMNRFLVDPLGQYNGQSNTGQYNDFMNGIQSFMNNNPYFSQYDDQMRQQFVSDMPQRFGSAYGAIPPAVTQNIGVGVPSIPGMRTY